MAWSCMDKTGTGIGRDMVAIKKGNFKGLIIGKTIERMRKQHRIKLGRIQ